MFLGCYLGAQTLVGTIGDGLSGRLATPLLTLSAALELLTGALTLVGTIGNIRQV
jgi:hypothetical protein